MEIKKKIGQSFPLGVPSRKSRHWRNPRIRLEDRKWRNQTAAAEFEAEDGRESLETLLKLGEIPWGFLGRIWP